MDGSDLSADNIFSLSTKKQSTTESVTMLQTQGFPLSISYRPRVLPWVKVGCRECLFLIDLLVHCQNTIITFKILETELEAIEVNITSQ